MKTLYTMIVLTTLSVSSLVADPGHEKRGWTSYHDMRYVSSLAFDGATIYVGTTGGIGRYDRYQRRWKAPLTTSNGLPDNWVERIAYDPSTGDLWFDTRRGVGRWQPIGNEWIYETSFPPAFVSRVEKEQRLPDLFMSFGYFFFPEGYIQDSHLRRYLLTDHLTDNWNSLWIGTWGAGVGRADLRTRQLEMLPFGLIEEDVTAMAFDGGDIWFGGGGAEGSGGISRFNRESGEWTYFEAKFIGGLRSDRVSSIAPDDEYIWFGTSYGLSRYDKKSGEWRTFTSFDGLSDDNVTDLAIDDNYLWVGTSLGLNKFDRESELIAAIKAEGIKNSFIYDVEVGTKHVWVGTDHGVYRCPRGGEPEKFIAPPGFLSDTVTSIDLEGEDVWFGVLSPGLTEPSLVLKIDEEGGRISIPGPSISFGVPPEGSCLISVFDSQNGEWRRYLPPYGPVYDLFVDKKMVWVATGSGVLKFDRESETWRLFTQDDGLPNQVVQTILPDGDHIWFGTQRGAARFYWNDPSRVD